MHVMDIGAIHEDKKIKIATMQDSRQLNTTFNVLRKKKNLSI